MKFMQNEQSSIPLFHSMFSLRIRLKSHIRNPRRACYWNGTFHIRENQRTHNISTDTWNHFGLSGLCCAANTSTNPHWDVPWAFILVTSNVASLGSWLCQHIDLWDVAVETIADRDINEPVVGTQWNCRLGTLVCQGGQSSPAPPPRMIPRTLWGSNYVVIASRQIDWTKSALNLWVIITEGPCRSFSVKW